MIHETFMNRWKGWGQVPPKDAIVISIQRSNGHILAPSEQLLTDWQNRKKKSSSSYRMKWQDYRERFIREMESPKAKEEIQTIATLSRFKDVYLVCSCWNDRRECHRFIVLELVKDVMEVQSRQGGRP